VHKGHKVFAEGKKTLWSSRFFVRFVTFISPFELFLKKEQMKNRNANHHCTYWICFGQPQQPYNRAQCFWLEFARNKMLWKSWL